jgi:hypothetical protein
MPRHASSPVFKYDTSVVVTPRERVVFNELSSDDDGDDEVDHKEEEEALNTLWERRVVRMVVDNTITRVDMRRLRLPSFPAGFLQPANVVTTDSGGTAGVAEDALVSSSSVLDARLRKGTHRSMRFGRLQPHDSFLSCWMRRQAHERAGGDKSEPGVVHRGARSSPQSHHRPAG